MAARRAGSDRLRAACGSGTGPRGRAGERASGAGSGALLHRWGVLRSLPAAPGFSFLSKRDTAGSPSVSFVHPLGSAGRGLMTRFPSPFPLVAANSGQGGQGQREREPSRWVSICLLRPLASPGNFRLQGDAYLQMRELRFKEQDWTPLRGKLGTHILPLICAGCT